MASESKSHGMAAVESAPAAGASAPNNLSAEERLRRAQSAKDQGNAAFTKKNFNLAVKCFSEAIDYDVNNHALYSNRSAAYMSLAKDDKSKAELAVADAKKCIALKPDWAKGYSRLATALFFQENFSEAIKAYAQGLVADPTDATLVQGILTAQKKLTESGAGSSSKDEEKKETKKDPAEKQKFVIGIDLGTTYSCVGVWMNDGVQIIANEDGERTLPSYVGFEEGVRYVGHSAKSRATRNPFNTVYDVKRIIGQRFTDSSVQKDIRHFPYKVMSGPDEKPIIELEVEPGVKKVFAPEELSAMVLSKIKAQAEAFLKQPVTDAVITVPAYFNDAQRNATKAAGAIAGLNVLRIINEPTAAALAYGLDIAHSKDKSVRVLIFDLGGGTFDVSLLKIQNGIFEVLATGGDTHLGGEDFDLAVVDFLSSEAEKQGFPESSLQANDKVRRRLRVAAERAKRQLSVAQETEIHEESLIEGKDFKFTLTRQKFEQLNKAFFDRCIETVQRVLKDAKTKVEEIDEVVLVGGSTRIPRIQQLLQQYCNGKELCKSVNPDEAVAYGAAVQGAILSGQRNKLTDNLLLMDVTPLSLGIETTGRVMSVIIPRNTSIPCVKTQVYTTEENYQTEVDVCVYEGERMRTDENNLLGKFTISGIERAKRGEPKVDVSFSLDSNGILTVTAKDQKTGAQAHIEIANRSRASEKEIEKMVRDAERFRREDEMRVKQLEAKNGLEQVIFEVLDIAKDLNDKKMKHILTEAAEKAQTWLDDNIETARPADMNARRRELERRIENYRT